MAELTLTGATLTSDGPLIELSSSPAALGASHQHAHSHSHSHEHTNASCSSQSPAHVHPSILNIPVDEVLEWEPALIFKRLSDITRLGSYTQFETILTRLKSQSKDSLSAVLDRVGDDGPSLLHWAAKRVDDGRFLTLLCENVSSNTINTASNDDVGMYPIHWACTAGSIPHVAVLLNTGADVECRDKSGCTPVLLAAQYGHVDLVAFLLQKGADGKAVDNSWDTALHWAAYKGSIQVCGLLLFRGEIEWTTTDKYGQSPVHLASLRGHTTVVRYLLQYGSPQERKQVLFLRDKNGSTPLDLAINRKRPNVQALLREAMDAVAHQRGALRQFKSALRQLCSFHSWALWMGFNSSNDEVDESPKFPFYFMLFHVLLATLWYPFVFLPLDTSQGVMWDLMGWNFLNILCLVSLWFCIYKTYTTDPGTLDDSNPKTGELRRLYEQTLESYSDEESFHKQKMPLCHTCHIAKPLRSKHCRVARRCVLMFDHHCPFVGNTVGLYNYKWFYLTLFFMALAVIGFLISLGIYIHRQPTVPWTLLAVGIYIGLFIIPSGGMCIYHTQLMLVNLTTNEHQNVMRYKYLFDAEKGRYKNLFNRGFRNNLMDRFFPTESCYILPEEESPLVGEEII